VRTLLNCGADPAVQNANGHNAVDVASSATIRYIYMEELLRATAASEYANISKQLNFFKYNYNNYNTLITLIIITLIVLIS